MSPTQEMGDNIPITGGLTAGAATDPEIQGSEVLHLNGAELDLVHCCSIRSYGSTEDQHSVFCSSNKNDGVAVE
ncbi:unnamed protein product [Ranitomeya imitator]|uniref:Uncharacterized protein n=1 Tax=Ranitomeya imitator TaxID=111125 RepID=A0ABN9L0P1_9NEOB|nr:unnamed protein product [Ranitomeya imitator]